MANKHADHEDSGYGVYLVTWLALLILTAITVTVAGMHLGKLSVVTALLVATIKGSAVLAFFMHLKYEKPLFTIMFYVVLMTLAIFIGLTFFDILFR
ncbi:MAG: cytochrome C oxidase subunit IV family protein [Candidatus Krumholzibacteriia bacterium]